MSPAGAVPDDLGARRGLQAAVARAQRWAADKSTVVDALFVAAMLVPAGTHVYIHSGVRAVAAWSLLLGMFLPLVVRRRYPVAAFAVVALCGLVQWLTALLIPLVDVSLLIALYSVAAHAATRYTLAAVAVMELGGGMAATAHWARESGAMRVFIFLSGMVTAATVLGINTRTRRAYLASLEERARRLEFERDQQAQIAAATERASIAREVHDVVTHSLSVMVALTDGASYAVHTAPDRAAEAVARASEVGRQAITDMQRVLGVLRGSTAGTMAELHPQPGLAQLDALLSEVRVAGLPVELVVGGAPPDLSSGVELAVFRVVQEALNNTRKHAEPGVSARVLLSYSEEAVDVTVVDDGVPAVSASGRDEGGGHGLAGMRERVAAFGGELETGPRTGIRGWRVHARVPVAATGATATEPTGDGAIATAPTTHGATMTVPTAPAPTAHEAIATAPTAHEPTATRLSRAGDAA
ncbi:sensor histidine kinase [Catenulispora subtropica]|uniref:histidine kinase n=1 Tax=Catenulispora subtropica TaxID=450798 RepID=A0ABP5EPT6_9ACTN